MVTEVIGAFKSLSTHRALEGLLVRLEVRLAMEMQVDRDAVGLPADVTLERLRRIHRALAGWVPAAAEVACHVLLLDTRREEHFPAEGTVVGSLAGVGARMHHEVALVRVGLAAHVAAERRPRTGRRTRRRRWRRRSGARSWTGTGNSGRRVRKGRAEIHWGVIGGGWEARRVVTEFQFHRRENRAQDFVLL